MTEPITSSEWKSKVIDSLEPVVVDFWAKWCAPCRMIAAHIERLAIEFPDTKVYKYDTDQSGPFPDGLQISSIPTVCVFKKGQVVEKLVGVNSYNRYKKLITEYT